MVIIEDGMVGCLFNFFAKSYGAKKVYCLGMNEEKLAIIRKAGADETFIDRTEAFVAIKQAGGADVVFECSGAYKALDMGLPYLKENGIFATYAVPSQPYTFDLRKVPNVFRYQRVDPIVENALNSVCDLLAQDKIPIELFLTHTWTFDQVPAAYDEVRKGNVMKGLVVIS